MKTGRHVLRAESEGCTSIVGGAGSCDKQLSEVWELFFGRHGKGTKSGENSLMISRKKHLVIFRHNTLVISHHPGDLPSP